MSFFEEWVELDLNPILSFSSNSKIIYSNAEAQFLLNRVSAKELFDLAIKYAPQNFGNQTSYIDLVLKNYTFYAITVRYENEDELHVKLYKSAMVKKQSNLNMKNIDISNIFSLTDLAISSHKITNEINFIKNYDPSIPEFKLNSSLIIKTLSQTFEELKDAKNISCSVKLKIGEYIRIEEKKYSLISLEISSDSKVNIEELIYKEDSSFILTQSKDKVIIDLPLII